MTLAQLPDALRSRAAEIRHLNEGAAVELERAAAKAELALDAAQNEKLTREEFAARAGCSPDSVTRAAREGRIRNVGRRHAPRFLAGDVAKLQGRKRSAPQTDGQPAAPDPTLDQFTRRRVAERSTGRGG